MLFVLLSLAAQDASAHVVMGTKSLHLRVAEAEIILRGRVVDPAALFVTADGKTQRAVVDVDVLERIKGEVSADRIRIAQDGHAVATYHEGEEALFFLKPIAKSRELRALALPGGPTHVSGQEHDEEFVLSGDAGRTLLAATRKFVLSESAESTSKRVSLIRAATLDLLTSGDARLADSALASLVLSPRAEWIKPEDLPRLHATLSDPANPVGFRAGLIDELERRGLLSGDPDRLALLRSVPPDRLASAIRAVGMRAGPSVKTFLLDLVGPESKARPEDVAEALVALGQSRDPRALSALSSGLAHSAARVRNAAIRGLGLFGGDEALRILEQAGNDHPIAATRRRAAAEARKTRDTPEVGDS